MPPPMKTFADLVAGRVARHVVYEDAEHLAVLAASPVRPGHTLVITKRVHPYLFDLSENEHAALWSVAGRIARHLKTALPCERVCVAVVGWEVRHVHVHLVPTDRGGEFPPLAGAPADESTLATLCERLAMRS
jgi:histidine triad (HIT) family protein